MKSGSGSGSESRSRQHGCIRPSVASASAEPSHFFKVVLPEAIHGKKLVRPSCPKLLSFCLVTEKMQERAPRIPKEFMKRFGNELCSVATVTVPDGLVWKMGLKKSANEVWLCDGWPEFVKYYSISYGSFLVFKYEGNSNFCVVIFDMTTAEIYYPCNNQSNNGEPNFENQHLECSMKRSCLDHSGYDTSNKRHKLENQGEIIDLDNVNAPSHGKSRKNVTYDFLEHSRKNGKDRYRLGRTERMSYSSKLEILEEIIDVDNVNSPSHDKSRRNANYNLREHSRKDGKDIYRQGHTKRMSHSSSKLENLTLTKKKRAIEAAQKFKPKNPSFTAILKPSNLKLLHVPASFVAKYLRKMGPVKFLESNGQHWAVHCTYYKDKCSTMRIGKGWIDFARDHHLREGDVCVFEIIQGENIVLKVTVFPCF